MLFYLKASFLITLLAGTIASVELDQPIVHSDCPRIDDLNHSVLLPYPYDCTKYYSCVRGLAYPQKCPNNLHWSQSTYRCDYPEIAKCQSYVEPTSLPPVIPSTAPMTDIFYELYPNDCNKYYECQSRACPINYHWNAVAQKCDFPHLAHCPFVPVIHSTKPIIISTPTTVPTSIVIPTAPTVPPTLPPTSITDVTPVECPECQLLCEGTNHIYLPYEKDCHKFIQCNGWEYIQTCPDNLFWNAKLNTCDRFCIPL